MVKYLDAVGSPVLHYKQKGGLREREKTEMHREKQKRRDGHTDNQVQP
jgi:hypothetical protein